MAAKYVAGAEMEAASRNGLRIIVLGYIVRGPLGGLVWHHLQYVLGLIRLGHDVFFVEDSGEFPACYDPSRNVTDEDATYGLRFIAETFDAFGLEGRWAYYDKHQDRWLGPCSKHIHEIGKTSDVFLNLSGVNEVRAWLDNVPVRVFVDTDPVFTQVRHQKDPAAKTLAMRHNVFFTFGENIPHNRALAPTDGLPWQATRQPIVLSAWPVTPGPRNGRLTTIMQWDSYSAQEHDGVRYGMKSDAFAEYLDLPRKCTATLELAMGSHTAPRDLLREQGWHVRDPRVPTRNARSYQEYIRRSKAEFSVAKHGYVISRSGWFSERSAAYLASGRPVATLDTGFSECIPTGAGLFSFNTPEEALWCIDEIDRDYYSHCLRARNIAETHFNSDVILSYLIDRAMQI